MWAAVCKDGEFYLTHIPNNDSMFKKRFALHVEKGSDLYKFVYSCLPEVNSDSIREMEGYKIFGSIDEMTRFTSQL